MKTKKLITLVLLFGVFGFASCNSKQNKPDKQVEKVAKVDTLMWNTDSLDARIAKMMGEYVIGLRKDLIEDTAILNTIGESQVIIQDLEKGDTAKASTDLKTLIGKMEVYLTKKPDAAVIPINVAYRKVEMIDNVDTAQVIANQIKDAVESGYYQFAKVLLNGLTSEMIISTTYLPVADYLQGLKIAAALLDDKKVNEAMIIMQRTLSAVVVSDVSIPLPILKAEVILDKAAEIDAKDHTHTDQVLNLLDNAKYQLKLAEVMGYGKQDKEYKDLYAAIKELEKSVKAKENSGSKFDKLQKELKDFKNRLFPVSKKK